jgi:hypothetical protein
VLDRAGRWVRRRQRTVVVTLLALALSVLGLSTSTVMIWRSKATANKNADLASRIASNAFEIVDQLGSQARGESVAEAGDVRQNQLDDSLHSLQRLIDDAKCPSGS